MQYFGRYEVQRVIGKGAMGIVYQCRDPQIGRQVAIKTVLLDTSGADDTEEVKQRIFKEAQAAGVLSHPNIVTIFDVGEDDGTVYIVMEYLEGQPLDSMIKNGIDLSNRQVISIVDQVGGALDFAHRKGIVHRDVKPANIMQSDDGRSILMDFGIAWMFDQHSSEKGSLIGSPIYMSPEQINGDELTGASDIYSLAAVAFELVTNARPFPGSSFNEIVQAKYDNRRKPIADLKPGLPNALEGFFDKALAPKVSDRYNTGRALKEALKTALYSQASSSSLSSTQSPFAQTIRKPLNEPEVGDENQKNQHMAQTMRMDPSTISGQQNMGATQRITYNQYQNTPYNQPGQEEQQQKNDQQQGGYSSAAYQQQEAPPQPKAPEPAPPSPGPHGRPGEPPAQDPADLDDLSSTKLNLPKLDEMESTVERVNRAQASDNARREISQKVSTIDFQRPEDLTLEGQRRLISELKMILPMVDSRMQDSDFICRVGSLYLRLSKYTEAMSYFKRAFKENWECVDAYFAIGHIYKEYKMDDKASDYWAIAEWLEERRVGKLSGKNSYRLGKKLEKISVIRGAITVWEEAGAMEPWHLDTWRELSRYYLQMKDYKRAMIALQHMVNLSKYDALAYRNLAVCYQNTKNYQKALITWEKALRLESKGEGAQRARKQIAQLKRILRKH